MTLEPWYKVALLADLRQVVDDLQLGDSLKIDAETARTG